MISQRILSIFGAATIAASAASSASAQNEDASEAAEIRARTAPEDLPPTPTPAPQAEPETAAEAAEAGESAAAAEAETEVDQPIKPEPTPVEPGEQPGDQVAPRPESGASPEEFETPDDFGAADLPLDTGATDTGREVDDPGFYAADAFLSTEGLPEGTFSDDDLPDPSLLLPPEDYYFEDAPPPPAVRENKFEKERRSRIRYQEVKQVALKDQAVRDMKQKADRARTDADKAAALREYYRMMFAKMVAIDPELEARCNLMEEAYLRRLANVRVEPSIPLNPPPTPAPLGAE